MKTTLLLFFFAQLSLVAFAQQDNPQQDQNAKTEEKTGPMFKNKKMEDAYNYYIQVKEALVASEPETAKNAAGNLQASLTAVENGKMAQNEAKRLAAANNLNEQRKFFASLSNHMATLVKSNGLSMGKLYLAYCPMANEHKGAYWLSNDEKINNPYFGDKMLECGSVKETIK